MPFDIGKNNINSPLIFFKLSTRRRWLSSFDSKNFSTNLRNIENINSDIFFFTNWQISHVHELDSNVKSNFDN